MPGSDPLHQQELFADHWRDLDPSAVDERFRGRGFPVLAGVDEAGRGPLAGPVVAGAVILAPGTVIPGLTDSKALSPAQRGRFFDWIQEAAVAVGVGIVAAEEIDRINILRATRRAMEEAVAKLVPQPHALLIDGTMEIAHPMAQFPLVKGDARSQCIAAASVVAKVTRDRIMASYHEMFPQYGFDHHKGYGTREHLEAIRRHGCSPIHRKTFRGVRESLHEGDQMCPSFSSGVS